MRNVLVEQPYAARRHRLANGPRFIRSMNSIKGIGAIGEQVQCASTQRVVRSTRLAVDPSACVRIPIHHGAGWYPTRPAPLHANGCTA